MAEDKQSLVRSLLLHKHTPFLSNKNSPYQKRWWHVDFTRMHCDLKLFKRKPIFSLHKFSAPEITTVTPVYLMCIISICYMYISYTYSICAKLK